MNLKKGMRVRAQRFSIAPIGTWSLAGMQAKAPATLKEIVGVVTHIYGNDPVNPTEWEILVMPDGETTEVSLKPAMIVEILP